MSKRKSPAPANDDTKPTIKAEHLTPSTPDITPTNSFMRASDVLAGEATSTPQSKRRKAIEDALAMRDDERTWVGVVKTEGGKPSAPLSQGPRAKSTASCPIHSSYPSKETPPTHQPFSPLPPLPPLPPFSPLPTFPSSDHAPPSAFVPLVTLYADLSAPGGPAYYWGPVPGSKGGVFPPPPTVDTSTMAERPLIPAPTDSTPVTNVPSSPPTVRPHDLLDVQPAMGPLGVKPTAESTPPAPPVASIVAASATAAAAAPVPADPEPILSPEQTAVLNRALAGESIFFTGSAGTGKSVLLRAIIRALRARLGPSQLGVTASTGMAALNIGGCTLHSWAGIQLGKQPTEYYIGLIPNYKPAYERWMRAKVLIVDEVSMLHGDLIDKLDAIGRALRDNPRPFGGIQIIFCGDFFQLPPVTRPDDDQDHARTFAFESHCWTKLFTPERLITLRQVFRQRDDHFVAVLERLRRGTVTEPDIKLFRSCDRELNCNDGIKAVRLYPRRYEVDRENRDNLKKLPGAVHEYTSQDIAGPLGKGLSQQQITARLNDATRYPERLSVKLGAQVMLLTNQLHLCLVNGSMGRVVGFTEPIAEQGELPDGSCYEVAATPAWPIVEFVPNRRSPVPITIPVPQGEVDLQGPQGKVVATRRQVPLILAWAMTIHKSQGLTLERVRVDVHGAFELGQVYVAISRVTSLDGLELVGFAPKKVLTSRRVLEWSDEMEQGQKEVAQQVKVDDIVAKQDKPRRFLVTSSP